MDRNQCVRAEGQAVFLPTDSVNGAPRLALRGDAQDEPGHERVPAVLASLGAVQALDHPILKLHLRHSTLLTCVPLDQPLLEPTRTEYHAWVPGGFQKGGA